MTILAKWHEATSARQYDVSFDEGCSFITMIRSEFLSFIEFKPTFVEVRHRRTNTGELVEVPVQHGTAPLVKWS